MMRLRLAVLFSLLLHGALYTFFVEGFGLSHHAEILVRRGVSIEIISKRVIAAGSEELLAEEADQQKDRKVRLRSQKQPIQEITADNIFKPGVQREASPVGQIQPYYPISSKKRGEEGEVVVELEINEAGEVVKKRILISSGFKNLNRAALNAFESAIFQPAYNGRKVIASKKQITFVFKLTD